MSQRMTLKRLREFAPPQDRDTEALRLPPRAPYRHYALDMPVKVKAHTLAQLRRSFDWRGPLAAAHAGWSAVFSWLRKTRQGEWAVTTVALIAGSYSRRMKRWESGLDGKDRTELKELGTLAAACREAWRRVGQPGLRESIREARHYAATCERMDKERATAVQAKAAA